MEVRIIPASYKIDFLFFTVALFTVLHFQTKDRSRYETIQHKDNNGIGTGTEAEVGVRAVTGCEREMEWDRVSDAAVGGRELVAQDDKMSIAGVGEDEFMRT